MTALHPLLLLLLLAAAAPASASTLAVSGAGNPPTVCGVAEFNGTLLCAPLLAGGRTTTNSSSSYSVAPFLSFSEVSAGRDFICGLTALGNALFCWPPGASSTQLRRVYNGPNALADLAVGADHVAAYDRAARRILWWRGVGRFPQFASGAFRSLVSGDGFSCAVQTNDSSIRCWGPRGSAVQAAFSPSTSSTNASSYSYLAAGGTRACAVEDATGAVRCSGGTTVPVAVVPGELFPYGLAVGDSHACGLLRPNHTAACWTLGGAGPTTTTPRRSTTPPSGPRSSSSSPTATPPAASRPPTSPCSAGRRRASMPPSRRCSARGCSPARASPTRVNATAGSSRSRRSSARGSGGGVVCKRLCDAASPPSAPSSPPSPPPETASSSKDNNRRVSGRWVAFVVVGAVGCFAGLCSIVYCLLFGFCSNKRVHNSVQPNITTTATPAAADTNNNNNNNNNAGPGGGPSPYGSPNGSRARNIFRRQLSRVMTRQRSGPSSFKDAATHSSSVPEEFSFAQLDAATKGFAAEAKIGEGSFGAVYRGKLPDGREVAIKRGVSSSSTTAGRRFHFQEKESAFRSELAFLSRLHHKHLVGLVGYCDEDDERLLVYEYMKNGALFDHLHPKTVSTPESPVVASWKLRVKILLDASRGIEYLHSYAVPPIIHRDIKSSNILLDAAWTARVSDFGLSLMGPPPETDHHSAVKAAGTVGYMDPEYYGLHHLTTKSDVYGLGVVMLETLTGKRAIFKDDQAGGSGTPVSVVDHAVPAVVAGELGRVLDPRAPEPAPNEAEAVELVAYTAVHCVRLEGKDRPAMADVVANLETAFALCEGSAGGGGGFGNSSSSASISVTSMDRSGAL
ncbi:hypothetical protein PR202_ga11110 [Eleusine coracana subsp. coracana]|uniref:Protein kinase domain-containing protein n=1 Tax=Eleusine coracana subsp. coracana TaxID=191504 RepID=A0AAV5C896_ELECO|nr:hypothetical protein PR202_ga11110 [Eleusine coracana subsp. coracana]